MMLTNKRKRKRTITVVVVIVIFFVAGTIAIGITSHAKTMLKRIPDLTFSDALHYTLKNSEDAVITVGIVREGHASYSVYGNNGQVLLPELHTYEIGSITKTFTAAMVLRAVLDGGIKTSDTIDRFIPLPGDSWYPTIADLLTHTSGYKPYYFEWPMVLNFFSRSNDFYGITAGMVTRKLSSLSVLNKDHPYVYSNFGYAVLGCVLEEVYNQNYAFLMDEYIHEDLHLENTKISDRKGSLGNYWDWNRDDAYLAAGGIVSNIEDMLVYAQRQLGKESLFKECHASLEKIDATKANLEVLNIRMDSIGMAWIIDEENSIIWHNGATKNYNSYLGFDPDSETAVVILSNLSPNYRIPSTVLGVKLMDEIRGR